MVAINREKEAVIAASDIKDWLSYNPKTGDFRWIKRKGRLANAGSVAGTINRDGYVRLFFNGMSVMAHRLAFFYYYGEFPLLEIDHLNGVRNDNRIINLKEASRIDNVRNNHNTAFCLRGYNPSSKNKTKCRNIYKCNAKYAVVVSINKKSISFGRWSTLEEAIAVRDEMLEHGWSYEYFEQKYPHKVKKRKASCES